MAARLGPQGHLRRPDGHRQDALRCLRRRCGIRLHDGTRHPGNQACGLRDSYSLPLTKLTMDQANEAVTVIITRVVRAGSEAAFENALRAFIPKSIAFPGHLGVHMLRPPPGGHEYGAVVKFRTHKEW